MFECPTCGSETKKLVAPQGAKKVGCPGCVEVERNGPKYLLHNAVDTWRGPNGRKHSITVGKTWEIERRRNSQDDNHTVVYYETGRETQR